MQTRGHQGEMVISWHPDISWLQTANTLVTTNIKAQNVHVQNRFYIRKLSLRWMNPNPQEYSCDCINVNASCVPCVCCSKLNRLFTLETGWSPQRHQPPHIGYSDEKRDSQTTDTMYLSISSLPPRSEEWWKLSQHCSSLWSASETSDNVHQPGINEQQIRWGECDGLNAGRGPLQSASSAPIQIVCRNISPAPPDPHHSSVTKLFSMCSPLYNL